MKFSRALQKNTFKKGEITTRIDPEYLTLTYIEMLEEAGTELLLYTTFCDVVIEGKKSRAPCSITRMAFCLSVQES